MSSLDAIHPVVLETEVESRLTSNPTFYKQSGKLDLSIAIDEFINSYN
jgi:hypothetical protein